MDDPGQVRVLVEHAWEVIVLDVPGFQRRILLQQGGQLGTASPHQDDLVPARAEDGMQVAPKESGGAGQQKLHREPLLRKISAF